MPIEKKVWMSISTFKNSYSDGFLFFSFKLFNLHYINKQRAYSIKISNIDKKITTYVLNLMIDFKSHMVVKITTNPEINPEIN